MNIFADFLFVCDAYAGVGLGHGSRCAKLTRIISDRLPRRTFYFQGIYTDGARKFLSEIAPNICFVSPDQNITADTAFVDLMADENDPEAWASDVVSRLMANCGRIVYMASGTTVPPLPRGVICVGYQPCELASVPPYLFWGMEFAPAEVALNDIPRQRHRAMVALGGGRNDRQLQRILDAISLSGMISDIDLLGSPVDQSLPSQLSCGSHQRLHLENLSSDIPLLLKRSGLVVTSFGNLGYEALAAGAPLCFVGQKKFQVDLADRLEERGLAVSAGHSSNLSTRSLFHAIEKALGKANELSQAGPKLVDGRGLTRIADIIANSESVA